MSNTKVAIDKYFTRFDCPIDSYSIPDEFTFPFFYQPHELSVLAAHQLQDHLLKQTDWQHDFGLDHYIEGTNIGKMFGVMVVQKENSEIGYISAFSGKLAGTNHLPGFVPPIYDLLKKDGFFKEEEDNISLINKEIEKIENSDIYKNSIIQHQMLLDQSTKEISDYKIFMKAAKKNRKLIRERERKTLSEFDFNKLAEEFKQESLKHQYDFKQLKLTWETKIQNSALSVQTHVNQINNYKEERKLRSSALQQKLFDQYQFLNFHGQYKGVAEIFKNTSQKVPPAGAGDCAAPKLLQFAYLNKLKPIAMAEFWWGQSPKSEIRKHKYFYPSCKSKCEPILGHMLKGLKVEKNPIQCLTLKSKELEIVYEDDAIVIVNKPAEFLSVPGKDTEESVLLELQKKYPEATGPILVHRLDMSTSGILLGAKTKEAHKILQKQFLDKTIKKRYIALLDGILKEDEGLIDLPLRVDFEDRPRQLVCYDYGKVAKTRYKVIEKKNNRTLVYFFPLTGRTHQLRVHAAHKKGLNTPIVGDDIYGKKENRLHLHAEFLEIIHPYTGLSMKFKVKPGF